MTVLVALTGANSVLMAADTRVWDRKNNHPMEPKQKFQSWNNSVLWGVAGYETASRMLNIPGSGAPSELMEALRGSAASAYQTLKSIDTATGMPPANLVVLTVGFQRSGIPFLWGCSPSGNLTNDGGEGPRQLLITGTQGHAFQEIGLDLLKKHCTTGVLQADEWMKDLVQRCAVLSPNEVSMPLDVGIIRLGQPPVITRMQASDSADSSWRVQL